MVTGSTSTVGAILTRRHRTVKEYDNFRPTPTTFEVAFWKKQDRILDEASNAVLDEMENQGVGTEEMSTRIGNGSTPSRISHLLSGNLTFRDLARMALALNCDVKIELKRGK